MSDASPRPSGNRGSAAKGSLVATLFVCLTVGLLLAGTIAPAASAGDTVALFSFDPEEIEAEPGDTVTVDVVLQAHEGYGGAGVDEVSFGVEYDPDVLTVTAIERTQWLEGETAEEESDEVSIDATTDVDDEAGLASIAQARAVDDDDDNGSVGTAPVATITLEVSEDARPTNAELTIVDSEVGLTSSYQQGTMVRDGEIVVDGGGESEREDDESGDDPEGVTLADDGGENESGDDDESAANSTADATADDGGDDADEATPGFGALVAMGTLVAVVVVRRRS
ncbi:cohesin domain-containing protein [Halomontanus rarus]|uniref:cohesin domain-containing protein n=1 Tax=Halomontanus rarus TaxID=3034020 RepID=UPI001A98806D